MARKHSPLSPPIAGLMLLSIFLTFGCTFGSTAGDPSKAGYSDSCAYWSPDSRWIAFDRGPGAQSYVGADGRYLEHRSDIYLAYADGSRVLQLTRTRAAEETIGWLTEPERVVYVSRGTVFALAPRLGARPQPLGRLRRDDAVVALFQDGRRLLVEEKAGSAPGSSALTDSSESYRYAVVDLARHTRLELPKSRNGSNAALSPDGYSIAYVNGDFQLIVLRRNRVVFQQEDTGLGDLAWSRDGRYLAYVLQWNIWLLDVNDGSTKQLTYERVWPPTGENWAPVWSADGKRIFYLHSDSRRANVLRAVAVTGADDSEIAYDDDDWGSFVCAAPSPDGTRIAFNRSESAGILLSDWSLLVVMYADGSDKTPIPPATVQERRDLGRGVNHTVRYKPGIIRILDLTHAGQ